MKKIIIFFVALFACCGVQRNIFLKTEDKTVGWNARYNLFYDKKRFPDGVIDAQGKMLIPFDLHACLCAWDLHGVVLKHNTWPWVLYAKSKAVMLRKGLWQYAKLFKRYGDTTKELKTKQRAQGFPESGIDGLYHFFIEDQFQDDTKLLASTLARLRHVRGYLDEEVLSIVSGLEKRGVHTHVLSNMNRSEAKKLSTLFSAKKSSVKDRKHHVYLADLLVREGNFLVSTDDFLLAKPLPDVYHLFLKKHPRQYGLRLFVDDKPENLKAAVQHGFDVGILMKTPSKLIQSFQGLGLIGGSRSA